MAAAADDRKGGTRRQPRKVPEATKCTGEYRASRQREVQRGGAITAVSGYQA